MQKEDGREKKVQEKQEKKALAAELAQINKMRQDREKERQQRLKQAGSKSKSKRAADDVQCPSKAARIVEDNPWLIGCPTIARCDPSEILAAESENRSTGCGCSSRLPFAMLWNL